jgi:hypothetical protein
MDVLKPTSRKVKNTYVYDLFSPLSFYIMLVCTCHRVCFMCVVVMGFMMKTAQPETQVQEKFGR